MLKYLIAYGTTLIAMLLGDFVWLGAMGEKLYRPTLGDIMLPKFRLAPALVFYFLYAAGVVFFAIAPTLKNGAWSTALLYGGLLGMLAYGTYDLTGMATLRNWTLQLTVVDMAWGAALTASAATVGQLVTSWAVRVAHLT